MDPSTLINEGSLSNGNAASYNLSEIWQFPMNSGGGESGIVLGLRRGQFAQTLAQFGDMNRDVSGNDPMSLDQRENHGGGGGGGARKRRDAEEESAKGVSTSNGNGNGVVFVIQKFNSNTCDLNPNLSFVFSLFLHNLIFFFIF